MNNKFYQSDTERWNELKKVRKKVAGHIQVSQGSRVLDVLVGEGDFARAIAKSSMGTHVIAGEIVACDLKEAKQRIERDGLKDRVELLRMDVTHMAFANDSFDYVVYFSGWEDFTSFSGEELIDQLFSEIVRVLKPNGFLAVTFVPELEPNDYVSKKDKDLFEFMYKSRKRPRNFHNEFFVQMFEKHGIEILEKRLFETPKSRLLPDDAKNFLEWRCKNYSSFFPDVKMKSYEEILQEFEEFIEKHGIYYDLSRLELLVGKKDLY